MLIALTACQERMVALGENGPDHSQACGAAAVPCPWPEECVGGQCEGYQTPNPTGAPPPDDWEEDGVDDGDDDDGDDGDGCGNFICVEAGTPSCDPGVQDCPEGEKCSSYVMTPGYCCVDANKCVPVIGDRQLGDYCERGVENDDCAVGLFCMTKTSGDTGAGVCQAFCDINDPASCANKGFNGSHCIAFGDGVLPLCQDDCDPLAQDCYEGVCYMLGEYTFGCLPPPQQPALTGEACDGALDCQPGLHCLSAESLAVCPGDYCCTPFCDCQDPDETACESPMESCTCLEYWQNENVGICALP
jgi:hypothetical protein